MGMIIGGADGLTAIYIMTPVALADIVHILLRLAVGTVLMPIVRLLYTRYTAR